LIFESIWELLEQRQTFIDMYFDPGTAPATFVPWLASWLGLTIEANLPEERRRRLVAEAFELYRWRGTAYGLQRMIELCTGIYPAVVDSSDQNGDMQDCVFRVSMRLPPESDVTPELIKILVEAHKPAHAGYVLVLDTAP
jgi:phage tail-like protein